MGLVSYISRNNRLKNRRHFYKMRIFLCQINFDFPRPSYSLCPDLANAATVSVSLIEGSRRKDSQIQEKMVLKRQGLEIFRSWINFWQDRHCCHIFWLYFYNRWYSSIVIYHLHFFSVLMSNRQNILNNLINFWRDRHCRHIFWLYVYNRRDIHQSSSIVYTFSQS